MQLTNRTATRLALWLAGFVLSMVSAAQTHQAHPVNVTIDASKTGPPISKYLYGQFLEHAGGLVNESVWAEMLDDRKFYYPITSKPAEEAPAPTPGRRRRPPPRRWTPIGGDQFISMNTEHPYIHFRGAQSLGFGAEHEARDCRGETRKLRSSVADGAKVGGCDDYARAEAGGHGRRAGDSIRT